MATSDTSELFNQYISNKNHQENDYFQLLKQLVDNRNCHEPKSSDFDLWQDKINQIYNLIQDELISNQERPVNLVKFGTSGWRGIIGKDLFCRSVSQVAMAIIAIYQQLEDQSEIAAALGVSSYEEAKKKGVVVGFDNRFGGELLAGSVIDILTTNGFLVYYAGEATTGTLSAAVLELGACCSVNLTPSHNPLEYAGFKFNAGDAGPAATIITNLITENARAIINDNQPIFLNPKPNLVKPFNALETWINLVEKGEKFHDLDYHKIIDNFSKADNLIVAIDCVHGASRKHINSLFKNTKSNNLLVLRDTADPTFGGIAPEPSSKNMEMLVKTINNRPEPLKLGAIIDPDGDRIRFTDGRMELTMNHFGAIAYHYLHQDKNKKGIVAKTVATSNFANALAQGFGEDIFEPRVGFKEFKPVIGKALVFFEESDGISIIGHTPEKDAYIGLLLALDLIINRQQNISEYLGEIEKEFGAFFPDRDGVEVSQKGEELTATLDKLSIYEEGKTIKIGNNKKKIKKVIDIDGRKMVLEDDSWLMVRPSGTEPKVRFYVEARTEEGKKELFASARRLLEEIGLIEN
jgi:phosphomannomutase